MVQARVARLNATSCEIRARFRPERFAVVAFGFVSTDVERRRLLTRAELAEVLRVSTRTVDRLAERGVLRPVRLVPGGAVRFRTDDVEALLR